MSVQKGSLLHFGPFTVDVAGRSLLREGVRVYIQEQPYQILLALLETPGQVVTRESLRLRLWGEETYVDFDQSLNSAVRRLRVALEDNPRQPVYVATVPRVGFRFLADVRESCAREELALEDLPEGGLAFQERSPDIAAAVLSMPLEAGRTEWPVRLLVVVFAAIGLLAGVVAGTEGSRLWNIQREKAASAKLAPPPEPNPAGAPAISSLNTAHPENSATLFTNEPAGSNFASTPARSVPDRGQVRLADTNSLLPIVDTLGRPGRPEVLGQARLTELTGWYHLGQRTEMDYAAAKDAFRQAIAADPRSPTPLVGLAESNILMALNGYSPVERLKAARQAGERALRLAPDLPDAHAVIGAINALERWDLPAAEREFHVALALDPHNSLSRLWLAVFVLLPQHRYAEAEQHTRMAIHDAPLSLTAHTNLGWIYASQGRDAAAKEQYKFVLSINPNFVPARFHLWQLLRAEGRADEAQRIAPVDPPASEDLALGTGELPPHAAGAVTLAAKPPVVPCQQIGKGLHDGSAEAIAVLRSAVRGRCPNFFFFGQNPEFKELHGSPEFAELEQTAFLAHR